MTVDEVPLWAVDGGIGHVPAPRASGGYVLCGRIGSYVTTRERPKRICRICRRRLAKERRPKAP